MLLNPLVIQLHWVTASLPPQLKIMQPMCMHAVEQVNKPHLTYTEPMQQMQLTSPSCIRVTTIYHRLQLFADSFRDHQVKCMSHTPATPLIMHLDYAEFTQTLIHVK